MSADPKDKALEAAFVALGVIGGATTPVDAAKQLLGIAVDMVPVGELKAFLTERDRIWADLAADVAEDMKLDP